jgi:hypothetical protein
MVAQDVKEYEQRGIPREHNHKADVMYYRRQ